MWFLRSRNNLLRRKIYIFDFDLLLINEELPVECIDGGVGEGGEWGRHYPPLARGRRGGPDGGPRHQRDAGDGAGGDTTPE